MRVVEISRPERGWSEIRGLNLSLADVEQLLPVHEAQLLTYVHLARKPVGLIINFNVPLLKDGIRRRVI